MVRLTGAGSEIKQNIAGEQEQLSVTYFQSLGKLLFKRLRFSESPKTLLGERLCQLYCKKSLFHTLLITTVLRLASLKTRKLTQRQWSLKHVLPGRCVPGILSCPPPPGRSEALVGFARGWVLRFAGQSVASRNVLGCFLPQSQTSGCPVQASQELKQWPCGREVWGWWDWMAEGDNGRRWSWGLGGMTCCPSGTGSVHTD